MLTISTIAEAKAREGEEIGVSDWYLVTQEAVDLFAEVTGDQYWIHTDPERARQTPFGGTIAHGYFTLSLAPALTDEVMELHGFTFAVNYGLNRVRFPAPMPVGGRVRVTARLKDVDDVPGGAQMTLELTFERDGGEKPVCIAETLARVYAGDPA